MTYRVKVLISDVKLLPTTTYGNEPAEAFEQMPFGSSQMIVSTHSRERFNKWLTALDNAGRKVGIDYEIVMTPS